MFYVSVLAIFNCNFSWLYSNIQYDLGLNAVLNEGSKAHSL
jgi:hypothetical protein